MTQRESTSFSSSTFANAFTRLCFDLSLSHPNKMSIVITAPTGNIGSRVTQKLLDAGENVVIVHRDPAKVKHFADQGAKVVKGSFYEDRKVAEEALTGAKAFFFMIPPVNGPTYSKWALEAVTLAATVAKEKGVQRVVFLSSINAQTGTGTGVINFLRDAEDILKAHLWHVVSLRAGFFFENFLRDLPTIASQGMVFNPTLSVNKRWAYVAASDIADVAAGYLFTDNWQGHITTGVHGPKDYTPQETYQVLSKAIGQPITPVPISIEQFKQTMESFKVPPFMIEGFGEFYESITNGRFFMAEPRTPETTTSTTLYEWGVKVFKPAYEGAKASQKK